MDRFIRIGDMYFDANDLSAFRIIKDSTYGECIIEFTFKSGVIITSNLIFGSEESAEQWAEERILKKEFTK